MITGRPSDYHRVLPGAAAPRVIDETAETPPPGLGYVHQTPPYDREQRLDDVRARLAYLLTAILALVIMCVFALVSTQPWTRIPMTDIQSVAQMVVTPVIALFGAATGFYFGAQSGASRRRPQQRRQPLSPGPADGGPDTAVRS
jgi:hypothetical protein